MSAKKNLRKIMLAIMAGVIIVATNYKPVKAAEKLNKDDFVSEVNEGSEIWDLFTRLNDSGEGTIVFVYDKAYDNSKKGVVKTSRGIYIGSSESTVVKKYGKGTKGKLLKDIGYNRTLDYISEDFKPYFKNVEYVISYKYVEKTELGGIYTSRIHFYIDKNEKVVAVVFSRVYEEGKNNSLYYFNKGNSFYQLGNYQAAIDCFDKCIQIDPKYTDAYITKGDALYFLNRFFEAIECYDKAINLPLGDTAYVYYSKGAALYYSSKYEEAVNTYDLAIKKDPNYIDAYNNKGDSLNKLGKYDDAWKAYDKVLEMQPDNVSAYTGKGNSFYFQERYVEAIEYYDKAISSDPTLLTAYSNKAHSLFFLDNYIDCLTVCDKIIDINVNYASAYYTKSKIYAIQNNEADFLENLKKAVDLDQSYIENAKTEKAFDSYRDWNEFKKIVGLTKGSKK